MPSFLVSCRSVGILVNLHQYELSRIILLLNHIKPSNAWFQGGGTCVGERGLEKLVLKAWFDRDEYVDAEIVGGSGCGREGTSVAF